MTNNAPVPPQNLDAEESILGAMMLNKNVIPAVAEVVRPDDFYRESHATIFRAAVALDARGEPVDAITLADELARVGKLDAAGGANRINEIAALVPASANAPHYANIVRDQARRRELIRAGGEIARLGWEGLGDSDNLVADAEQLLSEVSSDAHSSDFKALGAGMDDLYGELAEAVETGKPIHGLRTGFPDLDSCLTGLYPGQLIVLAARPSVGKSMFAQNICENIADSGKRAAFFTLEMSDREMQLRSIVRESKIDLNTLRTGRMTKPQLELVKDSIAKVKKRPLAVEDNPALTPSELRARARRFKQKHGLDIMVVDYLQLMVTGGGKPSDNRQAEVASISRSLKLLAKELEIPIIAVSQLNRGLESRQDKRPTLSDLRESGAIEQDADVVLFLYREETYKAVEPEKGGDTELIVAKNRMGAQDTLKLLFLGRRQTFATPAKHTESEAA